MARILVVDDDEAIRQTIRRILVAADHEVTEAVDGSDGLKKFRKDPPDLVIVDIFMPNKEGIETIVELRALSPGIPIVAMSGGGRVKELGFLKAAEKFGANATLQKPFRNSELLEAVRACLRH